MKKIILATILMAAMCQPVYASWDNWSWSPWTWGPTSTVVLPPWAGTLYYDLNGNIIVDQNGLIWGNL